MGREVKSVNKSVYDGKISNAGAQIVKGNVPKGGKNPKVTKAEADGDLRAGKTGK